MPGPGLIKIDLDKREVSVNEGDTEKTHAFASREGFEIISAVWIQAGWDAKYPYCFSWFGRPIIQLPEDLLRIQEAIFAIRPDVIVETGVAHGGSIVFYASLLKALGKGRVIGVDVEIRPHNRSALEAHELSGLFTLIEGNSIDPSIVSLVKSQIFPGESALVILDARHTRDHVLAELEAYSGLVSPGSYIVAADGIMRELVGAPRTESDWRTNNPIAAADTFLALHPEFAREQPAWGFNESVGLQKNLTYWSDGWLKRIFLISCVGAESYAS